jgi:hypothetical protein
MNNQACVIGRGSKLLQTKRALFKLNFSNTIIIHSKFNILRFTLLYWIQ